MYKRKENRAIKERVRVRVWVERKASEIVDIDSLKTLRVL